MDIGGAQELAGMPESWALQRIEVGNEVVVYRGPHVFAAYEQSDHGMRNLAIVGLTNAGFSGNDVARCFGLTPQYVSMIRGRARKEGSAGLVAQRGRRRALSAKDLAKAAKWRSEGTSDVVIARRLGVHSGTIGRRLESVPRVVSRRGAPDPALFDEDTSPDAGELSTASGGPQNPAQSESDSEPAPGGRGADDDHATEATSDDARVQRVATAELSSRYGGAMLLHVFLSSLHTAEIFSSLPKHHGRSYDATSLAMATTMSFALGSSSLEGAKHLVAQDAGALIGARRFPHLRTLRPEMKELAERCDPLAIQSAFSRALLDADDHPPELFYVDDHFVTYWGNAPVAKGYNIRRHLAEPGRDDTFVVDDRWRVICFSSGEPRGLSVSLPEVLVQLKGIVNNRQATIGFDRGGSYPSVFNAVVEAGMDWVTWRRAPLVVPTVPPAPIDSYVAGKKITVMLCDEHVALSGYSHGLVRQISAYEDDKIVFQILTSDLYTNAGAMLYKLRHRWCIENTNKYLEEHHGVHWLCTYEMDVEANSAVISNPARRDARNLVRAARVGLSATQQAIGAVATSEDLSVEAANEELARLTAQVALDKEVLQQAEAALKPVPATIVASELNPDAKRATPCLAARSLQMVCRLLAYNAELDLARYLNAYLDDRNEYRAITRHLLHLDAHIAFSPRHITVTLARPDAPRIAAALRELLNEIADRPAPSIPGDNRPIIYLIQPS